MAFVHQQTGNVDAGIVHDAVQMAVGLHGLGHHGGDVEDFAVLIGGGVGVHVADGDLCAVAEQLLHNGLADAGCAAGDDEYFAFQTQPILFHNSCFLSCQCYRL